MLKISIIFMICSLCFWALTKLINYILLKKRAKTPSQIIEEQKEEIIISSDEVIE